MDEVFCFLVFFGFVVFVVIAFGIGFHQSQRTNQSFQRVAQRYGGTVREAGLFGRPAMRFVHRGAHVLVDIYSTGGKHATYYTQFHISYPDRTLRCEVRPEGFFNQLGKFFGMQDIKIGSASFDPQYLISGNYHQSIRELLTPGVQLGINALRQMTTIKDIYIGIQAGTLLIKKRGYLRDYVSLHRFIGLCIDLYEEMINRETGIEFVENPVKPGVEGAICQICGDEISGSVVFCRSCKTPHHRDCWHYYGACSTYGCGQKRYTESDQRSGKRKRV